MKRIVKIAAMVLLVTTVVCTESTKVAVAANRKKEEVPIEKINFEFEDKVRRAGRIIAEEKGLLIPADAYETHVRAYAAATVNEYETTEFHREIIDNAVSLEDIYLQFPELADEAINTAGIDPDYVEPLVKPMEESSPEFGDYRSKIYYTYYERIETDEVEADTFSALAELVINIASVGLKPVQSIAVSVLQSVVSALPDPWTSCSDYHVITMEEKCLSGKWGEVYTSGGLFCETGWRGYCYASREDVYAIATAVAWNGNKCFSNTTDAKLVHYEYDDKYYDSAYLKEKSLELYQQAYDETYTLLYGVWPGYVEYNWSADKSWTTKRANPFK